MPRPRSQRRDVVLEKAMKTFWTRGYDATSMGQLVAATGSTRQSIYGDYESKEGLYRSCFDLYRQAIVEPALGPFTTSHPGIEAIAAYFEIQISLAEQEGLPGPGCLVGNAMTEVAPANPEVRKLVVEHNERLFAAFLRALPDALPKGRKTELAEFLVVAAQGLWAMSRVATSADSLRGKARTIVSLIEKEISDYG